MAGIRKSLAQIKAARPTIDRTKMAAASEEEIHRQMEQDGHSADGDAIHYEPVLPVRMVRKQLGMTQEEFAAALRIPLPTLRNWEQGRTSPDPAARALLTIVAREPEAALRALTAA